MLHCKFCYKETLVKSGFHRHNNRQIYYCKSCKKKSYLYVSLGEGLLTLLKAKKRYLCDKIININKVFIDTAILYKEIELSKPYHCDQTIFNRIRNYANSAKLFETLLQSIIDNQFKEDLWLTLKNWIELSEDLEKEFVRAQIKYLNLKYNYNR